MKYSNFKVGDYIIRRYNNRVYRIANTADSSGQEFLIIRHPLPSKHRFSCEIYTNMRVATEQEQQQGYAEEF